MRFLFSECANEFTTAPIDVSNTKLIEDWDTLTDWEMNALSGLMVAWRFGDVFGCVFVKGTCYKLTDKVACSNWLELGDVLPKVINQMKLITQEDIDKAKTTECEKIYVSYSTY